MVDNMWTSIGSCKCWTRIVYCFIQGCKHGKVDQKSAPPYDNHDFLGQTPISSSKMLFKIDLFS
jgi:hypothetical protein